MVTPDALIPVPPCVVVAVPEMFVKAGCAFEIAPAAEIAVRKLFDAPVSATTRVLAAFGIVTMREALSALPSHRTLKPPEFSHASRPEESEYRRNALPVGAAGSLACDSSPT
ncbi:MAG: hypothetical protein EPN91_04770 [Salinibacterium sp.]|nr:MAG: hypothetical protein EPN91_04770 [Salinibacterium sp.]